jgi:hypothetical protein
MLNRSISLGALLLLASCASLSPDQCRNADWRQIGYADGVGGLPGSRIQDHASACAKVGASPDMEAYLSGRMEGLVSYCQPGTASTSAAAAQPTMPATVHRMSAPPFCKTTARGAKSMRWKARSATCAARWITSAAKVGAVKTG